MTRTKTSVRALCAVAVVAASFGLQPHAAADRETVPDDTQSSESSTDIASVTHDHGPSRRILRHEIRFDGNPGSVSERVSLFFRFRNGRGKAVRRELRIATNPDGGLYGAFVTPDSRVTGYARAWIEDGSMLVVEFSVPTLGRPKNDRYRWHVWSTLGAGEFEEPCQAEDQGPPVCRDRAPSQGWVVHRL